MWVGDAFWATSGYSGQGRYIMPMLEADGHVIGHFPFKNFGGGRIKLGNITVFPPMNDMWGYDCLGAYNTNFKTDLTIAFLDAWVLPRDYREMIDTRFGCYFPIDHEPVCKMITDNIPQMDYVMQYSKFGHNQLINRGVDSIYIPHCLPTKIYRKRDRAESRKMLKLPQDAYVIGMVAANLPGFPIRKAFPENLTAFSQFISNHNDAILYLHTNLFSRNGIPATNFEDLGRMLNIPSNKIFIADQERILSGYSDDQMAGVYSAMDVLLASSMGEGFGLPIVEAQACGTPVIATNCSAMPEVTHNGILIEPIEQPTWLWLGTWHRTPDVQNIQNALDDIYDWTESERNSNSDSGVEFIRNNYDIDLVYNDYWRPFMKMVQNDIDCGMTRAKLNRKTIERKSNFI
jgi:glycosyltransferase involved in cell wall biosynthesis